MKLLCTILLIFFNTQLFSKESKTYFGESEKGWFWYETKPEIFNESEKKEEKPLITPPLSPRERLKKQGEEWEEALASAVLKPSEENIRDYLKKMAEINVQALEFAESFKKTIWVNPRYDFRLSQRPVTTQAIVAYNEQENLKNETLLKEIAKSKGILFFFKSSCSHCQRFAPVLKAFSIKYGFSVIPVSLDKKGIAEFPNPKSDFQIGQRLDLSVVPAVFLADPGKNEVAACSYGFTDISTLSQKVIVASKSMEKTRSK